MKYIQITLHGGSGYIVPPSRVSEAVNSELENVDTGDKITLDFEVIELEEDEYNDLVEFDGH